MQAKKPNILFILLDDLNYSSVGYADLSEVQTPTIDRLAQQGMIFQNAYIEGSTSSAVCRPSRAQINTGRNLYHIYQDGVEIPAEHPTLPEVLRKEGYYTFGTGKWHNGPESFARSFSGASHIFFGGMGDHWNVPVYKFQENGDYSQTFPQLINPFRSDVTMKSRAQDVAHGVHSTDLFSDSVIQFIQNYEKDNPFYVYLSYMAPHDPRVVPEKYMKLYENEKITLPPNIVSQHLIDTGELSVRDEIIVPAPRSREVLTDELKKYYAMVSHIDDRISDIVRALQEKNLLENAVIIFTSDNGLAMGQHGLMGKQALYEHSVKVPLFFSGKGINENTTRNELVTLTQLYATICQLAEVPIPDSVQEDSIFTASSKDSLYFTYKSYQRAIVADGYKYIEYFGGERQLFHLEEDPWEMFNLSSLPEYQKLVESLANKLEQSSHLTGERSHSVSKEFWQ